MSKAPLASQPATTTTDMDELPVISSENKTDKPDVARRKPVYRKGKKRLGMDRVSLANWDVLPADITEAMGIN